MLNSCSLWSSSTSVMRVDQPPASQHRVHSRHTISRSLDLHKVIGLHQPWRGLQHKTAYTLKRGQKHREAIWLPPHTADPPMDLWRSGEGAKGEEGRIQDGNKRNVNGRQLKKGRMSAEIPNCNQSNGALKKVRIGGGVSSPWGKPSTPPSWL